MKKNEIEKKFKEFEKKAIKNNKEKKQVSHLNNLQKTEMRFKNRSKFRMKVSLASIKRKAKAKLKTFGQIKKDYRNEKSVAEDILHSQINIVIFKYLQTRKQHGREVRDFYNEFKIPGKLDLVLGYDQAKVSPFHPSLNTSIFREEIIHLLTFSRSTTKAILIRQVDLMIQGIN